MAILQKIQLCFALVLVVASPVPSAYGFQNLNVPTVQKSSSLHMTVLSYNGKKKNFKPGSPLSKALPAIGIRPRYSCKKGDCATCQVFIAGRATRACTGKVPPEPTLKSLKEKGLEVSP
eukprot:CAMPEP_0116142950 /NCGR_PEP_ID=MMETSP0329-20121206/15184_1 /TAXON_ID=697910 /ORGANISM="Pseudo-nitzschia arenysensis, Strain B593" /LENGTH=118 /DNA_ID=CAMNT_0003638225 /DNA_START=68 /DNA_END=424 /DNA_ORIENTATION=+